MKKVFFHFIIGVLLSSITSSVFCQVTTLPDSSGSPFQKEFRHIRDAIIKADTTKNRLLTPYGYNIFLQRKALQYLTGVADLALAKFYASYSNENDKLNMGFNIPITDDFQRLHLIINPIFEADIKKTFSKIYEDRTWQNNIRAGAKVSYLIKKKSLNFRSSKKNELQALRARTFKTMVAKEKEALKLDTTDIVLVNGDTIHSISRDKTFTKQGLEKVKTALYQEMGVGEADYLEKSRAYSSFRAAWLSLWGFAQITPANYFITPGANQAFQKRNYNFWEINLQYTAMYDFEKIGSFYGSVWLKYFQNNSVNTEQLTSVDYNRYFINPPNNDTLNYTQVKSYKGYLGTFSEFITTMLNVQLVYLYKEKWFVRPGLSIRYEKNFGVYNASNLRFGLPLIIQGKDKPVTLELQYRIDDIYNYQKIINKTTKKTLGISVGLPFTLLYK